MPYKTVYTKKVDPPKEPSVITFDGPSLDTQIQHMPYPFGSRISDAFRDNILEYKEPLIIIIKNHHLANGRFYPVLEAIAKGEDEALAVKVILK